MENQHSLGAIKHMICGLPRQKLVRAAAQLAPIVGASIAELIPNGESEAIVAAMRSITEEQTKRLLRQLESLTNETGTPHTAPIAVIGSGNLEMLLHSPSSDTIELGSKHSVKVESLCGGSGVNFAARLLSVGRVVLPVLPIKNDHAGKQILAFLQSAAKDAGILGDIRDLWQRMALFNSEVSTPTTVFIVHGSERTAFRQQVETGDGYLTQMKNQIEQLFAICDAPSALMIGHVPRGRETPEKTVEVLDYLIDRYRNRTLIYSVMGSSQLRLGWRFWEKHIRENMSVFQLNLSEAKSFFSADGKPCTTEAAIDHLKKMGVSAIITMDRFGAIATHSHSEDIYIAWPLVNAADVIDSTGAGDAFAAGAVSVLSEVGRGYSTHDFEHALAEGSRWAGAACTTLGGAGRSPGKELAAFVDKNPRSRSNNIETRRHCSLQELLTFVDLAYD